MMFEEPLRGALRRAVAKLQTALLHLVYERTIFVLTILFGVALLGGVWHLQRLYSHLIESTALEEAARYTDALVAFRTLYTREVVETVRTHDIVVTHDYDQGENKGKAIPLPATLSMLIGNRIARKELGGQTALYSGYPFPWREKEWQQRDQFSKDAWEAVTKKPDEVFHRIETRNGRRWLRYATADLMRQACVNCHNSHADTPKRDWKTGDVRGVLEVSLPLDTAVVLTRSSLQGGFVLLTLVGVAGLSSLAISIGKLRRNQEELEERVQQRTAALAKTNTELAAEVAERKRAEQELTRLAAFPEQNPHPVIETDLLGHVTYSNPVAKACFPDLQQLEMGHPFLAGLAPIIAELQQGSQKTLIREIEIEHAVYEQSICYRRDVSLVAIYGQDITARKQVEQELRGVADELARSNSELEQFAYVASHDLQQPLRTVAGFCQLLKRRYQGRFDEEADEFLDHVVGGATGMQELINDLLTYSRVGASGKPFEATDCAVVVAQTLADLKWAVEESGAVVTCDELPTVLADAAQLSHLFQNLLDNGIKFHSDEPPRIHISAERNGRQWIFSICDNGIGIDPKHAERIFAVFQRLHGPAEYSGTGIGLAICKKVLGRHGGRIWVESEAGQGAAFYFTLPAV